MQLQCVVVALDTPGAARRTAILYSSVAFVIVDTFIFTFEDIMPFTKGKRKPDNSRSSNNARKKKRHLKESLL